MIFLPEILAADAVQAGFTAILGAPAEKVDEIFGHLNDERKASVLAWVLLSEEAGGLRDTSLEFGFPGYPPKSPAVYFVIGASTEGGQFVGGVLQQIAATDTEPIRVLRGSIFESNVRCICLSTSGDLTIYLQAMVTWALLTQRDNLEFVAYDSDDTRTGLMEQRIAVQDLAPIRELEPDIVLAREVRFTCQHVNSWLVEYEEVVTDVEVDLVGDDYKPGG